MNLRQLEQFLAVAETGNFHRAAERLNMAQPPLSQSIKRLEDELGAMLFDRTSAGVRLTAAGSGMLAHAKRTLFHAQQCKESVRSVSRGEAGVLRLGFVGAATYSLLPRLIPSFRKRHPAIDLELTESTSIGALDGLTERRLDAAIIRFPVFDPRPFQFTRLERDEFVLAVNTRSPLAARKSIALSEAENEPFVIYSPKRVPSIFALTLLRCQHSGFRPRIAQEATQIQTILSLVKGGLGVALVASISRRYVPSGVRLVSLSDTPPSFEFSLALVHLEEEVPRVAETLRHHALEALSSPFATAPRKAPTARRVRG